MKISHIIVFILMGFSMKGQVTFDHLVEEATHYLNSFDKELLSHSTSNEVPSLAIFKTYHYEQTQYKDSLYSLEIDLAKKDIGLNLRASGKFDFSHDLIDSQNTGQFSKYQMKVGIEWKAFKEGFKHNSLNKDILKNKQSIHHLNSKIEEDQLQYSFRYQSIIRNFNVLKYKELSIHLGLFEKQLKLFTSLYYYNLIPYTNIIDLKKRITETKVQLNNIKTFNNQFSTDEISFSSLPAFNININELIQIYQSNNIHDSILQLKNDNLNYQQQQERLIKLNLFAEYQFKTTTQNQTRLNPFIGANLAIPLNFSKKQQQLSATLQKKILNEEVSFIKNNKLKEIYNHYYEYQYLITQLKKLNYQLQIENEHIKTQTFIKNESQHNLQFLTSSFHHQNRILEIRREILDHKRLLYLKALKIFTLTNISSYKSSEIAIISKIHWEPIRNHNIYIIFDTEKNLTDIQFFIQYLKRKNFKNIYLKHSISDKYNKTRNLLKMEGFNLADQYTAKKQIRVDQFQSSIQLYKVIESTISNIAINDLHSLIELEKLTLNKQIK
ncbi:hypothetical protein UJ101_02388 [Flavobacteriaceae bacterium UJ101]|nr:hypothetical protein UJ101_02388 [Flavobacteriaceae bacterium UJ101]